MIYYNRVVRSIGKHGIEPLFVVDALGRPHFSWKRNKGVQYVLNRSRATGMGSVHTRKGYNRSSIIPPLAALIVKGASKSSILQPRSSTRRIMSAAL